MNISEIRNHPFLIHVIIAILTAAIILTTFNNAQFIIDTSGWSHHWTSYVGAGGLALMQTVTIGLFSYLCTQRGYGWTVIIVIVLIGMQILGNSYSRSLGAQQSVLMTAQGEEIKRQIVDLRSQLATQVKLLGACPATHLKNCKQPAQQKIDELQAKITQLSQDLQQTAVSPVSTWSQSTATIFDLKGLDIVTIMSILFGIIVELVIAVLSNLLISVYRIKEGENALHDSRLHQADNVNVNLRAVFMRDAVPPSVPTSVPSYPVDSTSEKSCVVQGGTASKVQFIAKKCNMSIEEVQRILSSDEGLGKVRKIFNVGMDTVRQARQELGISSTK